MRRRGIHTSEFLAALLVGLGSLVAALEGVLSPKWAALAAAVAAAAFNVSRGLAKRGNDSTNPPPPPAPPQG